MGVNNIKRQSLLLLGLMLLMSCAVAKHDYDKVDKISRQERHHQKQSATKDAGLSGAGLTVNAYVANMGKGLDVDWSKTSKGMESFSPKMVADFKKMGFGHVRIRVANDISNDLLNTLEKQVDECIKVGLLPVVAYQANAFKNQPNSDELEKAAQWWQQVAERFKDKSPKLSFDLIIEVTDALNKDPKMLNHYHEHVTQGIRKTNPQRIIFISPRLRSDPDYLSELKIPTQHRQMLATEWHFYAAGPTKNNAKKLWTIGTEKEKQLVRDKINTAKTWSQKTGIPTWVGAWMPGNYNDGNNYSVSEQVVFANFVACELDKAQVPFAVNSDTKFYDAFKQQWIETMLPVVKAFLYPSNCK